MDNNQDLIGMILSLFSPQSTANPSNKIVLPIQQEISFRHWYQRWAKIMGLDPNPDDPRHHYDYRAAYLAGAEPTVQKEDNKFHWPSEFKGEGHPNLFVNGVDTSKIQR